MTRIVVLGGGPAGMAAAVAAAEAGGTVTLIDEGERLGGQFWRHHPTLTDPKMQHAWARYQKLEARLGAVTVHTKTAVFSIEITQTITLRALRGPSDGARRDALVIEADRLIIATGAHDRALPIPGWTLPGVTTAGAAQALAKRDGVTLGKNVLIAGAGPFLLPVAQTLTLAGARVAGVHEASRVPALAAGWLPRPWELVSKAGELIEYVASLIRHRTRYSVGSGVIEIRGNARVESAIVAKLDRDWNPIAGTEREVACDSVALGHDFTPRLEAAAAAGCRFTAGSARFVEVDDHQQTTVPGVYAAGEITGIGGADAALAEGEIAGLAAAGGSTQDGRWRSLIRVRNRMRRFAQRLTTAHGVKPGWMSWVSDDTIVCRCESVTRAMIDSRAALASRAFRLASRAGLGPCQARTCGTSVQQLVGHRAEGAPQGWFDRRPLLAPVRLGEIAHLRTNSEEIG